LDWRNPGSHRRLCYYPSSGDELLWAVMQLDSDLFVFADADRTRVTWASMPVPPDREPVPGRRGMWLTIPWNTQARQTPCPSL
jgi:hypothetical protein